MKVFQLLKRLVIAVFREPDAIKPIITEYQVDAMKQALASRWPNVPSDIVFDDTAYDARPPKNHEEAVERVKYNRLGLSLASAIERRNKFRAMVLSVLIGLAVTATYLVPAAAYLSKSPWMNSGLALIVALAWGFVFVALLWFSTGISPMFYEFLLPRKSPLQQADVDDANDFVQRVLKKYGDSDGAPSPDLADRWRNLAVDANGEPVDGQILQVDFRVSEFRETLKSALGTDFMLGGIVVAFLAALAMLVHSAVGAVTPYLTGNWTIGTAAFNIATQSALLGLAWLFAAGLFSYISAKFLFMSDRSERRAIQAQIASEISPTSRMVEEVGREPFVVAEHARKRQFALAQSDKTAFIRLGTSTKTMAARRDPFAPSETVPFGLSVGDLSTHLLMLGDTGTGKTAGGIRPVLWQWLQAQAGGAVILDGKGALPREVATDSRFQLITPEQTRYNPIAGLTPDDIANTLHEQNASGDGDSAFWEQSAARLVRASATILDLLVKHEIDNWTWNLGDLYKVSCSESIESRLRKDLTPYKEEGLLDEHALRAIQYRLVDFPMTPDKMRGSITGYAQSWLTNIVDNRDLSEWVDAVDSDVDIHEALKGGIVAFDLPEAIYGPAGPALSSMIKSQLYRALKIRGDLSAAQKDDPKQTAVLMLIDECQEIVAQDDVSMLPIARSLGLRAFFSTQALDGFYLKLGEDAAQTLLAQFRSVVSLTVNGERTKKFVSDRMGAGYRMQLFSATAIQSDAASAVLASTRTPGGFTQGSVGYQTAWRSEATNAMRNDFGVAGDIRAAIDQLAGTIGLHDLASSMSIYRHRRQSPATFSVAKSVFVEPEEVPLLTSAPFVALASINRCNVPRRDVIELEPMFEFPSVINETSSENNECENETEDLVVEEA